MQAGRQAGGRAERHRQRQQRWHACMMWCGRVAQTNIREKEPCLSSRVRVSWEAVFVTATGARGAGMSARQQQQHAAALKRAGSGASGRV